MKWFGKKDAQSAANNKEATLNTSVDMAPKNDTGATNDTNTNDKDCYTALQELFTSNKAANSTLVKVYIENFKHINDLFGYEAGEELLQEIVAYLKKVSGVDIYHFIGVEYIMILEGYSSSRAQELCQKILDRFEQVWKIHSRIHDTDCTVSVSIGICMFPSFANSSEELLKCLDMAVTQASNYGTNQLCVYDTKLHKQFLKQQSITLNLQSALENEEIQVRYRPTYSIKNNKFTRAELYMRIFIPEYGFIGAQEFTPIAEDSGQLRTLEYFVLEKTAICIHELCTLGIDFECISTRISPIMLLQEDFVDRIKELIEKYEIPANKMGIEISETPYTSSQMVMNIVLQELSDMNIEIIFNDYGTSCSAISNILELPINTVKLERMFIWQMESNDKAAVLIDGLIKTATNLGLNIIAEGVETPHQLEILKKADCEYQQGFYYSPTVERLALFKLLNHSLEECADTIAIERDKMMQK